MKECRYFIEYQGMLWRPQAGGYTYYPLEAGVYSEKEVRDYVGSKLRSSRGDRAIEVKKYLRDSGFKLDEAEARIRALREWVNEPEDECQGPNIRAITHFHGVDPGAPEGDFTIASVRYEVFLAYRRVAETAERFDKHVAEFGNEPTAAGIGEAYQPLHDALYDLRKVLG